MTNFVLVHGAWHGGWAWDALAHELRCRGHRVTAPTLPSSAGTSLNDHVTELHQSILDSDGPATVVAHSYSGVIAPQSVSMSMDRVEALILVDGWVTTKGQSLLDVAPEWFVDWCHDTSYGDGPDRFLPPPPPEALGLTDEQLIEWLKPRLVPQPTATFTDKAEHGLEIGAVAQHAIACRPETIPFADMARGAGFTVHDIVSDHEVMLTRTEELADLLEAIVDRAAE